MTPTFTPSKLVKRNAPLYCRILDLTGRLREEVKITLTHIEYPYLRELDGTVREVIAADPQLIWC